MYKLRKSADRGFFDHGWLKSFHTFSFAEYFDRQHMHFGALRVINEDRIAGGKGFPTHAHKDMEIITYLISGTLEHKDSTGAHGVIRPYEVQKMSAGRGVQHSEFNASSDEEAHLLQIWIIPNKLGILPGYEQKNFSKEILSGMETLIASPDAQAGSMKIEQDARIFAKTNQAGEKVFKALQPERIYWLQVVKGDIEVSSKQQSNACRLTAGDAVGITAESELNLSSISQSEFLFFDLSAEL